MENLEKNEITNMKKVNIEEIKNKNLSTNAYIKYQNHLKDDSIIKGYAKDTTADGNYQLGIPAI